MSGSLIGEMAMSIWDSETLILRLIAVLFVFALLRFYQRGKDTGRETVLYIIIVSASATVNLLRYGGGGLFLTIVGALAALALSVPVIMRDRLMLRDRVSIRDVAAVAAAGALLGPSGGLAAVAIAAAIHLSQRLPGRRPELTDWLLSGVTLNRERPLPEGRSILMMIESRRLHESPRAQAVDGPATERAPARAETLPWRTSLAVAMLALLLTGAFV
jgi:hypothetical protein